ncbi:MAG: histidinol-phosphatase HisJ family protein [Ruminococcaceae bacterium]|nr:histidinol-phosphatase HisJ family protein [Oscillospiraceae bacterium]
MSFLGFQENIMKSNLHTHSSFCDGKSTCEEIVVAAINKGFTSIGFSGHAYTDFDLRYCMKDTEGYINEVKRLKEKYKGEIEIYLGVEEDAHCPVERERFDYIIGSSHYYALNGEYYPIDSSPDHFKRCLEVYNYNVEKMAEDYFGHFCDYINERKPDIVGHFDLITKFDEMGDSLFLKNEKYNRIAEKCIEAVADSGCVFEVNTGAISRGYRRDPYPAINLLYILKKHNAKVTLASDSHSVETLDFGFDEAKKMLKDIGFKHIFNLHNGHFVKEEL